MGEKRHTKTDSIFYYDFCDMGATIPCCVLEGNFCHTPPCSACEHYLTLRNAATLSKILKLAEKKTGVGAIFVKEYSFMSIEKALFWYCNTIQQGNCRFCKIKEHFPQH